MKENKRGKLYVTVWVMVMSVILTGCGIGEVKEIKTEKDATKAIYRVREEVADVSKKAQEFIDKNKIPKEDTIDMFRERVDKEEEQLKETESYSKATENLGKRYKAAEKQIKEVRLLLDNLEKTITK